MGNYNRLLPGGDLEQLSRQLQDVTIGDGSVHEPTERLALSQSSDAPAFYHNLGGEVLRQTAESPES